MIPQARLLRIFTVVLSVLPLRAGEILFQENFENGLSSEWQKVSFSGETRNTISHEGTNSFLEARAMSSASGLAVKLPSLAAQRTILQWRWKIDRIPPGSSDSQIETFDHTARLFVAFKTLIGPPRTINYVWANEKAAGQRFEHPHSSRARFIALESGNGKAGAWIAEKRDIAADWKLLFGDDEPPAIVSLGFMTDSDGTKTSVTGCYDDIQFFTR